MGWVILLVIIGIISFVLINFFDAKKQQAIKIQQEGGMRKKYSYLVDAFFQENPNARVLQENYDLIRVCP